MVANPLSSSSFSSFLYALFDTCPSYKSPICSILRRLRNSDSFIHTTCVEAFSLLTSTAIDVATGSDLADQLQNLVPRLEKLVWSNKFKTKPILISLLGNIARALISCVDSDLDYGFEILVQQVKIVQDFMNQMVNVCNFIPVTTVEDCNVSHCCHNQMKTLLLFSLIYF